MLNPTISQPEDGISKHWRNQAYMQAFYESMFWANFTEYDRIFLQMIDRACPPKPRGE